MKYMVAVTSPKKSENVIDIAAAHAIGMGAELIVLRVIPDPTKVGVIAQLISTDRPQEKASEHIELIVSRLKERGITCSGEIRTGPVAKGIVKAAEEHDIDVLFAGACHPEDRGFLMGQTDPIMRYLVDNLPMSLCVVRTSTGDDEDTDDENNGSTVSNGDDKDSSNDVDAQSSQSKEETN